MEVIENPMVHQPVCIVMRLPVKRVVSATPHSNEGLNQVAIPVASAPSIIVTAVPISP
jgi:hypothetical protein